MSRLLDAPVFSLRNVFLLALSVGSFCSSNSLVRAENTAPQTVIWDGAYMAGLKSESQEHGNDVKQAFARVREAAGEANGLASLTVTARNAIASSGDIHDYVSYSRYWWPNPDTEDGLPYIRKDGIVNRPLVARGDRVSLGSLVDGVQALSLAYYFFGDEESGRKAAELVRIWFLDPETHMNPNLNFGQGVPGKAEGRGAGIIDTRGFILLLDALTLLDESVGWRATEDESLRSWFRDYRNWLQTDPLGQHELAAKNNHGSWYDAQVARYSVYANDFETARQIVEAAKQRRIEQRFQTNGMQPEELTRTLSLHYSMFNLSALVSLARIGEHPDVGVDLWSYVPSHGCGLECAHRALVPFITREKAWEHEQVSPFHISRHEHMTLRFASCRYKDTAFQDLPRAAPIRQSEFDFTELLVPRFAVSNDN